MKLTHITALGLCAAAFGVAYGCSSPEAERQPVYITATGGATGTTGGKAGTGGTMQVMTAAGGKVNSASGGTGGASGTGGNKAAGSGGTASGSGGANNNNTGGKSNGTGGGNTGGASNGNTGGGNTGGGGAMDCTTAATVATRLKTYGCENCHTGDPGNGEPPPFTTAEGLMSQIDAADPDYAMCGSGNIVATGSSATSVIVMKLKGMNAANCKARMPKDAAQPISAADMTCVEAWINGLQ